jgi:5'(3')-deoxyribonucleotidase
MVKQTKRLVIAVDCDDVLVPTSTAIVRDYNRRFGTNVALADMYQPATLATWGTDSDDVAIERVNEFLHSQEHAQIVPDEETVRAVKLLASQHELHLITGRADFLKDVTRQLLDTYFKDCFLSVEHTNYVLPSTSTAIRRSKGQICKSIGATVLIDDHLVHGQDAIDAQLEKVILFGDYPWNRQKELPYGIVRCVDWFAVTKELDIYAGQQ